jgi:hypothetical protein
MRFHRFLSATSHQLEELLNRTDLMLTVVPQCDVLELYAASQRFDELLKSNWTMNWCWQASQCESPLIVVRRDSTFDLNRWMLNERHGPVNQSVNSHSDWSNSLGLMIAVPSIVCELPEVRIDERRTLAVKTFALIRADRSAIQLILNVVYLCLNT